MVVIRMTAEEANRKLGTNFKITKKNKFNAKKTAIGDMKFDSESEGNFYAELMLQVRAGLIKSVECQVKEELFAYGKHICNYYCDFLVIHNNGVKEYLEHKSQGTVTQLWRFKWKMLEAKYSKEISRGEVICNINWYKGYKIIKRK